MKKILLLVLYSMLLNIQVSLADKKNKPRTSQNIGLSILLDIGMGLNSNPTYEALSSAQESNTEALLSLETSYKAIKTKSFTTYISYMGKTEQYSSNSSYAYTYHDISFPFNYYARDFKLSFKPFFSFQYLGGDEYLNSNGGRLIGVKRYETIDISFFASGSRIKSRQSIYDYASGDDLSFGASSLFLLNKAELYIQYSDLQSKNVDSSDTIASYKGSRSLLSYYLSTENYSWYFSVGSIKRKYKLNPATQLIRSDVENFLIIVPTYFVSENISSYWSNTLMNIDSNDSTRSYSQFVSILGFRWALM